MTVAEIQIQEQIMSQGAKFRAAYTNESPLQIPGTINAYTALMAEQVGYNCLLYTSDAADE